MKTSSIDAILQKRRIIITCGTGGVGKTTLSAALALRAACLGKNAAVITIDPAKRLATSLGLGELGDQPLDLTPQLRRAHLKLKKQGLDISTECKGTLAALMPDTRRTFEAFIHSLNPSPAVTDQILRNPIFQIFAREFSGSNEYMALERLYALNLQKRFDCIILDTPPSRNTLAFLDAPKLLTRFFEERLIRWLVLPTNKIVSMGMKKALGVLEKLTGSGFMTHLFDFASALFEVQVAFSSNLKKITELLESEEVGFLVVSAPISGAAPEISHFIESIENHGFHFDGVALNRTLGYLRKGRTDKRKKPNQLAFQILDALQDREAEVTRQLQGVVPAYFTTLPELARDVHSIEDLIHVATAFDSINR